MDYQGAASWLGSVELGQGGGRGAGSEDVPVCRAGKLLGFGGGNRTRLKATPLEAQVSEGMGGGPPFPALTGALIPPTAQTFHRQLVRALHRAPFGGKPFPGRHIRIQAQHNWRAEVSGSYARLGRRTLASQRCWSGGVPGREDRNNSSSAGSTRPGSAALGIRLAAEDAFEAQSVASAGACGKGQRQGNNNPGAESESPCGRRLRA